MTKDTTGELARDPDDTPMAKLREEYADNEVAHDRNPTEDGFVEWLARSVSAARAEARPTPHLDAIKAERDAAVTRAIQHRRAAHEAAGQLDALRRERDQYVSLLAEIGDALSPTGERPPEALGTLAADVSALVAEVERLRARLAAVEALEADWRRLESLLSPRRRGRADQLAAALKEGGPSGE